MVLMTRKGQKLQPFWTRNGLHSVMQSTILGCPRRCTNPVLGAWDGNIRSLLRRLLQGALRHAKKEDLEGWVEIDYRRVDGYGQWRIWTETDPKA